MSLWQWSLIWIASGVIGLMIGLMISRRSV